MTSREDIFIPEHRTNVLPLRWIANGIFHPISMWFFHIGLRHNDRIEWDKDYKWHNKFMEAFGFRLYNLFNYPYEWWGTYYKMSDNWKDLMSMPGAEWSDYDENGHPYWLYTEWQEDPETGDAWRLVRKD
jgi:hypothetical protein